MGCGEKEKEVQDLAKRTLVSVLGEAARLIVFNRSSVVTFVRYPRHLFLTLYSG